MNIDSVNPQKGKIERAAIVRISQWLYGVSFGMALAFHILLSYITWNNTITYDYFCGNPLMGYWARWFVFSLVAGVLVLPGGVWSLKHKNKKASLAFSLGSLLYLLIEVFMLVAGVRFGTVPDFIFFIEYVLG